MKYIFYQQHCCLSGHGLFSCLGYDGVYWFLIVKFNAKPKSVISFRICRPIRHDLLQVLQVLQVPRPYQDRNLQNEPVVLP